MRLCITAIAFIAGVSACSHQPDRAAQSAEAPRVTNEEDRVPPASLDETARTSADPRGVEPIAPRADSTRDTNAPLVATTKEPSGRDVRGAAPSAEKDDTSQRGAPSEATPPAVAEPDNTAVNQRDRNPQALTPLDQGNGRQDLDITQRIRQAVMAEKSLSFTAKNVKIITQAGKVTLRGPVASAEERNTIDAAARKVAGGSNVDNQLEIKK